MIIHIIVSEFNQPIPNQLLAGALNGLKDQGIRDRDIVVSRVPGAFELPIAALTAGEKATTTAVICLGVVIRGDTSHYDYVCQETARGIMDVGLKLKKPILFGVLTTENEAQALARSKPDQTNKGYECAVAALMMIKTLHSLR